jgi:DNA-directed RNA polymerase subunit RPC12/RpoP
MVKKEFICDKCERSFKIEVYEKGEAEEIQVRTSPVRCPQCGGPVRPAR